MNILCILSGQQIYPYSVCYSNGENNISLPNNWLVHTPTTHLNLFNVQYWQRINWEIEKFDSALHYDFH